MAMRASTRSANGLKSFGTRHFDQQGNDILRACLPASPCEFPCRTGGVERRAGRLYPGTGGCRLAMGGKRIGLVIAPLTGADHSDSSGAIFPPLVIIALSEGAAGMATEGVPAEAASSARSPDWDAARGQKCPE